MNTISNADVIYDILSEMKIKWVNVLFFISLDPIEFFAKIIDNVEVVSAGCPHVHPNLFQPLRHLQYHIEQYAQRRNHSVNVGYYFGVGWFVY